MKILKVGIIVIVVVLAVTLLTLRVTGLEPEYLDLDQLRAHHMIARPGLWLKGEVVTTPVTDWSFVDQVSSTPFWWRRERPISFPTRSGRCLLCATVSSSYVRTRIEWTCSFRMTSPGHPMWPAIRACV
jgi:hypothetical protein